VSFITPSYNYASVIADCLMSVARQDWVRGVTHEHVVVDDGSTDSSVRTIRRAALPITLVEQGNRGQGAALNTALHHARGEWICWLPADDFLMPWALSVFSRSVHDSVDVIFGDVLFVNEIGAAQRLYAHHPISRVALATRPTLSPPATFMRASRLHGWDEEMRQLLDWDLWLRLARRGAVFQYAPGPLAAFRRHPGQVSQNLTSADRGEWSKLASRYELRRDFATRMFGQSVRMALKAATGGYARQITARRLRGRSVRWFESRVARRLLDDTFGVTSPQ
jgi:glycosyltransferase involved in cell wall biosynthesis